MKSWKVQIETAQLVACKGTLMLAVPGDEAGCLPEYLADLGFTLSSMPESAETAAALLEQARSDLVLMSVNFGGAEAGIQIGKTLHQAFDVPIVYLAPGTEIDAELIDRTLDAGSYGFLVEPVQPTQLLTSVKIALARHQSESQARLRGRRLNAILSSIADAVITVDRDLRITYMNREAESITEHPAEESISKDLFAVFEFPHEQAREHARHIFQTVLAEGIPSQLPDPTALIGKYGSRILIGDSVAPIVEDSGNVSGLVIVFRSVSTREEEVAANLRAHRHAQAAVLESERRNREYIAELNAIMDSVPATILITRNTEASSITGNGVAYRMLHLPPGTSISTKPNDDSSPNHFRVLSDGKELAVSELPVQVAARTGQPVRSSELEIEFDDGARRTLFGDAVPLLDEAGRPWGSVGVFFDITERKQMEASLQRANKELQRFAYVASHDLQEPLRTIMLGSELFHFERTAETDAQTKEFVSMVQQTAGGMKQMIVDVLAHARASATVDLCIEKTSSAQALRTAIANLNGSVTAAGAEILQPDELPDVMANPVMLHHVFQNIIGNAIKFHRPSVNPIVRICTEKRGSDWVFAIRDNGTGFTTEQSEKLFGLFERLHGGEISGTGIGLAACKNIIEHASGRIWAEGEPGVGATFYFSLPSADA